MRELHFLEWSDEIGWKKLSSYKSEVWIEVDHFYDLVIVFIHFHYKEKVARTFLKKKKIIVCAKKVCHMHLEMRVNK